MSDQKIAEFRQRAEVGVPLPDPDLLLERGHALRRRRQLVPVVAVAAAAVLAIGVFNARGADTRTDPLPPGEQVTESPDSRPRLLSDGPVGPGTYGMDRLGDTRVDFLVDLVGENWQAWNGGGWMSSPRSTVSWGLDLYAGTTIDQCRPNHPATRARAVTQLSKIPGPVTQAARPARRLGMTGTHVQVRIPVHPDCPTGDEPSGDNLMAIWHDGSTAPTVTVDVWLLGDGEDMLILTRGVRGTPSAETLGNLDRALESLRPAPAP